MTALRHVRPAAAGHVATPASLGTLCFHAPEVPCAASADRPVLAVPARPLTGADGIAMSGIAGGGGTPTSGTHGCVQYCHDDALLYATCRFEEAGFGADDANPPLRRATAAAYAALFDCLAATGFPHLVRCWNYLPDINRETCGLERYRQFNAGRQDGFLARQRSVLTRVPAACALGTRGGGTLAVAVLAARADTLRMIENPRQTSAWTYPPQYGERRPTFARAALLGLASGARLYVSGTAAIVGHRSVHAGDVVAQTDESLANIAAICTEVARTGGPAYAPDAFEYTVYVRDAVMQAAVQRAVRAAVGGATPALYVEADICRSELLVEIEAVCMS